MKILIVNTYHYLRGGDCRHAFGLSDLLKRNGHEVHFFSMKNGLNFPCKDECFFVNEIDFRKSLSQKRPIDFLRVIKKSIYSKESKEKISKFLDIIRPDIVHLHSIRHHLTKSILPEFAKRKLPVLWTLHDYKELCPNTNFYDGHQICEKCTGKHFFNVVRNRCKKGSMIASVVTYLEAVFNSRIVYEDCIDKYISPSRFLINKFIDAGYDLDRFLHLPNFLDIENFTPHYEYENYLLYLGRLEDIKGVHTLIDAFKRLKCYTGNLQLKIAGTGSLENEIRENIHELNSANIDLLGHLQGKELERITQNAKAIVIPSEWYENYPFSALEAMAYGKPIIASRIGGIPELVDDNITGLLFEPFEPENIVRTIIEFEKMSSSEIKTMGQKAREKVERNNNPEKFMETILDLYQNLIQSKQSNQQ